MAGSGKFVGFSFTIPKSRTKSPNKVCFNSVEDALQYSKFSFSNFVLSTLQTTTEHRALSKQFHSMADYLNMSLDSIISSNKDKIGNFANNGDFNNRNTISNSSRNNYKVARTSKQQIDKMSTSTNSSRSNSRALPRQSAKSLISIKFLISNELSGSMIGPGGAAIKELMDLTR